MGSAIIVADQEFDIGHEVRTFRETGGYNAYLLHRTDDPKLKFPWAPAAGMEGREHRFRERRMLGGARSLSALKQVVRQVVVHLDGCKDARMCFDVLHNQHGLSVHFMVDNDGTIYQTLDLVDCAFHASGVNEVSVGIELQNRGDAARFPNYYKVERPTVSCTVHDTVFLAYDFTEAQYIAMSRLAAALARVLEIPLLVPRGGDLGPIWTTIEEPRRFAGFLGHYHLTREKWDPGPWDFPRLFRSIGSRLTFPLTLGSAITAPGGAVDPVRFHREAERYFDKTERDAPGRFPLGPFGESRLWHGGVHLLSAAEAPVLAPLAGHVVAAKMSATCALGSCNFVLLRHQLETATASLNFFTLFVHVRDERGAVDPPPWLERSPEVRQVLEQSRTALFAERVEAGEVLAHMAEAGPEGARRPQVHFAVFAGEELGQAVDPGYWRLVRGGGGRLCRAGEINDLIDRAEGGPRDGLLSRREITRFFREDPERVLLRRTVIHHLSEWTGGDWATELLQAEEFRALSAGERRRLVEEQIEPTLWWTRDVARHAGLPEDGMVYSYHPIGFLVWYEALMRESALLRTAGIRAAAAGSVVVGATDRFKLDAESTAHMTDAEDLMAGDAGQKMTLDELIRGYPD